MSGEAVGWAFRKVAMDDATTKFVLVAICNYANDKDEAWPSHAAIARLTGLSKRTIQNGIQKLEDWGIIKRVRRDRDNGSETSAMVSIDIESSWVVRGGIATRATGVTQQVPQGVASDSTLETTLKQQSKKKRAEEVYSEEFEALWLLYPRIKNTSKKDAWNAYRMLSAENQQRVRAAVPLFAADMRAEGRPQDKIKHMVSWLNGRMYETAGVVTAPAAKAALVDWHKTASREQWIKVLPHWRENYSWNPVWGPAPGKSGCMLPEDLLTELEKYQIILDRDGRKVAEAAISDASQLRDAINAAHAAA